MQHSSVSVVLIFAGDVWHKRGRPPIFPSSGSQDAFQPLIHAGDEDDSDIAYEFEPLQQQPAASPVHASLTS